eukprot:CAMPEP_0202953356 /NCGR_PEP_ID=MMETSP1395-20130829/45519_1 /ASSEMBLY_ACC=CAM_ASM_000871 /TAXON_ID=5961 /ORGANISM="Blepharisma japonicum, Strain Stock R1072" /LENGTH=49 /DNA_ID=CAMNT_0049666693 /DNA_START=41 /DNA_END=190 /DNA_ORIENTATION=+
MKAEMKTKKKKMSLQKKLKRKNTIKDARAAEKSDTCLVNALKIQTLEAM